MTDTFLTLDKTPVLRPYTPRALIPYELMTDAEITNGAGGTLIVDSECYSNYFLIAFRDHKTKKVIKFELGGTNSEYFNPLKLSWIMHSYRTIGFNTLKYDLPLIWLAYVQQDTLLLKRASDEIIINNARPKDIEQAHNFKIHKTNTIDLIEVCPLKGSLKLYGARLHSKRIQDLPFDPHEPLEDWQFPIVADYCINSDLPATELLFDNLTEQLQLRTDLSLQYQQDLMSKSDAQIAEAVIGSELKKLSGKWPQRPKIVDKAYYFTVPPWMKFATPQLQDVLQRIATAPIETLNGRLTKPKELFALTARIGDSVYKLGLGGLHSTEKKVAVKADDEHELLDRDVASYYPAVFLNQELFPPHLGKDFLIVYKTLVDSRLEDKKAKRIAQAECKKITINGTFGKTGSPYSILYSPNITIQITFTGQLALLMLIEQMELRGIQVVSANTDGIVMRVHKSKKQEYLHIISMWEQITGFTTEETEYVSVFSRDVNAYIAVKTPNKAGQVETKGKNIYYDPWTVKTARDRYWQFQMNPDAKICVEAIEKLIVYNIPIEKTITECIDITRFVSIENVSSPGAHKDGNYLGKTVRWYFAKNVQGAIHKVANGHKVPNTDGAMPLMDIDGFPNDIDYQKYIEITKTMLYDCGYLKRATQMRFF